MIYDATVQLADITGKREKEKKATRLTCATTVGMDSGLI